MKIGLIISSVSFVSESKNRRLERSNGCLMQIISCLWRLIISNEVDTNGNTKSMKMHCDNRALKKFDFVFNQLSDSFTFHHAKVKGREIKITESNPPAILQALLFFSFLAFVFLRNTSSVVPLNIQCNRLTKNSAPPLLLNQYIVRH